MIPIRSYQLSWALRRGACRGSALLLSLYFVLLFGSLAVGLYAMSMGNMVVSQGETQAREALMAAESGMAYLVLQFRIAGMPVITEGSIADMTSPSTTAQLSLKTFVTACR